MPLDRIIILISYDLVKKALTVKSEIENQFRVQRRKSKHQDYLAGIVTVTSDTVFPTQGYSE